MSKRKKYNGRSKRNKKHHSKPNKHNKRARGKRKRQNTSESRDHRRDGETFDERPGTDENRFNTQQRKQDLFFALMVVAIIICLIVGYYFYSGMLNSEDNNDDDNIISNNKDINDLENNDEKITWTTYETGLQQASSLSKPVMIDFYTDWCVYCVEMDRDTYSNPEVIQKAEEFVCVKVDGDVRQDLISSYGISGYPTTVFLDSSGNEILREVGYIGPSTFLNDMNRVLSSLLIQ